MLPAVVLQAFVVLSFVGIGLGGALARVPLPLGRRTAEPTPRARDGSRGVEALWLAAIGFAAVAYPLAILVVPSTLLAPPWALRFSGDEAVQLVGFALVFLAEVLVGWSYRSLGKFATVEIRIAQDHKVVRTGPYATVRHPMYLSVMLLSLGFTLAFLSSVLWLPFAVIVLVANVRAHSEERLFLSTPEVAEGYRRYVAETGRFLPALARTRGTQP